MATHADVLSFRATFVGLDNLSVGTIASSINTASVLIGDGSNWPKQTDYVEARMQLAAHIATLTQMYYANATIDGTGMSDLYVSSIKFGERTIAFGRRTYPMTNVGDDAMLQLTMHGQLFLMLRNRNIIPIMIV